MLIVDGYAWLPIEEIFRNDKRVRCKYIVARLLGITVRLKRCGEVEKQIESLTRPKLTFPDGSVTRIDTRNRCLG